MVQSDCYEVTRILFVRKENKNNDFIQQFVSSTSAKRHFEEYPQDTNYVRCFVSAVPQGYAVFVQIKV